jgi:small subunit ribosomal protein S14
MAKRCMLFRETKRKHIAGRDAAKRLELKARIIDQSLPFAERMAARDALNALPRDGAVIRQRNRCAFTGRPRGYYGRFGLGRNMLRRMASLGLLPGVRKGGY